MSGKINTPDAVRAAGGSEALNLAEAIINLCDGHDSVAVLAALTTAIGLALYDLGVSVDVFAGRLTRSIANAERIRKEATRS
jgi:hypothetical protein